MDGYREKIKRRAQLAGARCGLVPLCLLVVNKLSENAVTPLDDHASGFMLGLSTGFVTLVLAWSVFEMCRIERALKDETLLKKMYISETDERRIFIQNKVGGTGLRLAVFLLVFAAILACYFNITITYTLIGAALGVSLMMAGFKLYYRNKY